MISLLFGMIFSLFFVRDNIDYRVILELDSRAWHDTKKDMSRDFITLLADIADEVLRIQSIGPFHCVDEYLYPILHYVPELFSKRGTRNIKTVASLSLKNYDYPEENGTIEIPIDQEDPEAYPVLIKLIRMTRTNIQRGFRCRYRNA